MKKIIFALFAVAVSFTVANAQSPTTSPENPAVQQTPADQKMKDEKVKIKAEELPDAIRQNLEGTDYQGWTINAAYRHANKDAYEVELMRGTETKSVKFDKDGKKLEE